jgi:hypothetical protein
MGMRLRAETMFALALLGGCWGEEGVDTEEAIVQLCTSYCSSVARCDWATVGDACPGRCRHALCHLTDCSRQVDTLVIDQCVGDTDALSCDQPPATPSSCAELRIPIDLYDRWWALGDVVWTYCRRTGFAAETCGCVPESDTPGCVAELCATRDCQAPFLGDQAQVRACLDAWAVQECAALTAPPAECDFLELPPPVCEVSE